MPPIPCRKAHNHNKEKAPRKDREQTKLLGTLILELGGLRTYLVDALESHE